MVWLVGAVLLLWLAWGPMVLLVVAALLCVPRVRWWVQDRAFVSRRVAGISAAAVALLVGAAVVVPDGWLPIPHRPLPFPSILATSTDDALGNSVRLRAMANAWGSREHSLGAVGHLNGASGFGEWPEATSLIEELTAGIRSELVPA